MARITTNNFRVNSSHSWQKKIKALDQNRLIPAVQPNQPVTLELNLFL